MGNEEDEHQKNCKLGDGDHVVTIQIEFLVREDSDGEVTPLAANIQSHLHGVPNITAAETLLIVAQQWVADQLAHTVFEECPSDELKHAMAEAASLPYMKNMIDHLPDSTEAVEFSVPNDLSELLGEE